MTKDMYHSQKYPAGKGRRQTAIKSHIRSLGQSQLAKKYHPDTNKDPQAAKKFQEVSEAYEVLSDDARRKQYDQWGTSTDFGAGGPNAGFQGFQSTIDPEELFRKIFGDFGLNMGFQDFAESQFGFGSSKEVNTIFLFFKY
ncbi:protein tumorous imaginal discs, mitochondrial-like [Centruroides sculpturatus]|uniref:protein tumorous imaginal discs, mitochondrial-like n=1 Tax=Centruroides sculpturatus TaxID=218467 RepID=UPI000C6DC88E|nr:protein tumorous imaginal discs, mitochondrial-like [Centruroides sculpturatus]